MATEITYIKKEIEDAGRMTEIQAALQNLMGQTYRNYPVRLFIDQDGNPCRDLRGSIVRQEAKALYDVISKDDTTLETIYNLNFNNLEKYASDHVNALFHNYAVAVSHRRQKKDLPNMKNIRVWAIIQNLLACAVCGLCEESNTWFIPDGWKKKKNDEE